MKTNLFISVAATLLLSVSTAFAQSSEALKVKTVILDNGLTVWLNEDPNQTAVFGAVVVKAGAVDCPGTGIAHYFEHIMFKGTDKIGTIDYEAEKPYLDSIAVMYDKLALAETDEQRKDIQKEINRLNIKASDYAVPNEFNNLISEMGGSSLNAFTSYDETAYFNQFLPEYFEQWAELNSERIMNPVFRLFQSELETVYEEKNRSDDNLVSDFRNTMLKNVYEGSGYSEEVIGTTANLKNPSLSQMRDFFDKYYVASNMGLVLTGNIKAEEVLPIIEKTFGRIRKGEPNIRPEVNLTPIKGVKETTALINMPLVKLGAICFRGPSKTDEDFLAVNFITSLLNNDAGTGLLDKLIVNHKIMMAMAMPDLSFKDAGSLMVLYMPKLIGQSDKKARKIILKAFNQVTEGDFSDDFFESCKLSYKKQLLAESEDLATRMQNMVFAFAEDLDWNEVVSRPEKVDQFTKEQIVAVAKKYIGEDYIVISKKKGIAPKDNLEKPDYEKVVPKNKEASSAYAQAIRKSAESIVVTPKAVDLQNDADTYQAAPLVKVFASANPYNDVFALRFIFGVGQNEKPALGRLVGYINLLGSKDKSFDEIHTELQTIGSALSFSVDSYNFYIDVTGFDSNLDETLAIASDFIYNIKGDKKKLNNCKTEEKSGLIMNRSDMDALASALVEKVVYGENSSYIADMGEFTDKAMMSLLQEILTYKCDVCYSGTLSAEQVATAVNSHFDLSTVTVPSQSPYELEIAKYDGPQVFFVDKKDAAQSNINAFIFSDPLDTQYDRYFANVFSNYLGGGMSSLMFQEIREFRSMAYATSGGMIKPEYKHKDDIEAVLRAFVGTQADKTFDAMDIVDSLLLSTPFVEERIDFTTKETLNSRCNYYPDFRSMPEYIADDERNGLTEDPVDIFLQVISDVNADSMKSYWEKYVSSRPIVWAIVGNSKKIDMEKLAEYGPVTIVKPADIIK